MAKVTDDYLEARRQEILEAAARVFIRHGFDAATMQDIAAEADVSTGSIYRYFPGKDDLVTAVCCAEDGPYPTLDDENILEEPLPLEALRQVGESIWREIESEAGRMRAVITVQAILEGVRGNGEIPEALSKNFGGHRDVAAELIRRAQSLGHVSADVDARDLATLLIASTVGMQALSLVPDERGHNVGGVWAVLASLIARIEPPADVDAPTSTTGREHREQTSNG